MGDWNWNAISAIATVGAAITGIAFVVLNDWFWQAAADQVRVGNVSRETDLMLRLMTDYDSMRADVYRLRECTNDGNSINPQLYMDEATEARRNGQFHPNDQSRHALSRFFVRIRKLVQAKYLSEDIVARALSRQAIEDVFLKIVDPLDRIAAPTNYKDVDRVFYISLLHKYWPKVAAKYAKA